MDAAEEIAEHVAGTAPTDIPDSAVSAAKKVVTDLFGAIIAGSSSPESRQVLSLVRGWAGRGESRVLVHGDRVPAPDAGFVNGVMGRARDFDDVHEAAVLHPSVSVVPAALAAAELRGGVTGREFMAAVVLGVDLTCRLGMAPTRGPNVSGMSTTWQCGAFGSAAAASKVLGLDADETLNAMGIAYSQASGNQQSIIEGATVVGVQQGLTTKAGITSALLAMSGVTGPREALEGRFGYYPVYHRGEYERGALLDGLGERYEIVNTSIKPYPCCKWTHQAIEAALCIIKEDGVEPEAVEAVEVRLNRQAYNLVCEPMQFKRRPRSVVDAQFSVPFTVAAAIVRGGVSIDTFTEESIRDPEILEMAQRVEATVDPGIEARYGREIAPEIVEVRTTGGETHVRLVEHVRGSPHAPMSFDEVKEKFRRCTAYSAKPVPMENVEEFLGAVSELEKLGDVSSLIEPLTTL
ncbi:MmgE/PrpD family protein [Candidatus Bathyarchaeota archaeon]|nr:MmgE/PrpD family protein [Candidatus Bathyarchaeota archaeon]